MLEMLVLNDALNATLIPPTIPTVYERNIHTNNDIYNYDAANSRINASTAIAAALTTDPNAVSDTAAALLTDVIMNTSAVVVDYATQWLTTTIATTATNLTNPIEINETATSAYIAPSSSSSSNAGTPCHSTSSPLLNNRTRYFDGIGGAEENLYEDYPPCHHLNPNFNCSIEKFVEFCLGPKTLPLYKALLVTIVYGVIFISGILGNVLICVVIVRQQSMHTATNYYLFSLAVSDLIFLVFGLPTEVVLYWHQYPYLFGLPFCKVRAYISEACSYVSVFTIVAFSVERYLAICHPLHLHAMSGFKRPLRYIALLWFLSFLVAIPFGYHSEIYYLDYPLDGTRIVDSAICTMFPPEGWYLFEMSFAGFFLLPMILIIYFYGRMGMQIRATTTQQLGVQKGSMHRVSKHQQSRKAVIRMLAAVVLTFFLCWLPFHIQRLFYVYGRDSKYFNEINEWLFSITGFVYYVSCTVNPILYNVMSHRYRVAFKDTLCGKRRSGFRDQTSFRDPTVATSISNNGTYDRVNSTYGRSFRITNNTKDRASIKSNNVTWKNAEKKEIPENHGPTLSVGTNAVVVCVDNGVNGRAQVFTENDAQESLLSRNNETCI